MTNGEIIKKMFPNMNFGTLTQDDVIVNRGYWGNDDAQVYIPKRLWNAEYKQPVPRIVLAQDRYQDLLEYFGDKNTAKIILEDREEFKAWLERIKWHVKRVDELARELEQLKETTKDDLAVDCVSRRSVLDTVHNTIYALFDICGDDEEVPMTDKDKMLLTVNKAICSNIKDLPSVLPMPVEREDSISRRAVLDYIERILNQGTGKKKSFEFIQKFVEKLPSVTTKSRTGNWIDTDNYYRRWKCSKCGYHTRDEEPNFCPNCGTKMVESEDKNENRLRG